ncbi:protein of unknown function [Magnetospirillum sp. XM-1]|nr:protein of unknown function [Magnetospirillum sp. XM-1]
MIEEDIKRFEKRALSDIITPNNGGEVVNAEIHRRFIRPEIADLQTYELHIHTHFCVIMNIVCRNRGARNGWLDAIAVAEV